MFCYISLIIISLANADPIPEIPKNINFNLTRRILRGHEVGDTRPYMVYLRPANTVLGANKDADKNWLCGGVIIHERYILTSAACIEDVQHFYVISGTHRWTSPDETNICVDNGSKKAIWKCVPKSYIFDGRDFDNIRWMKSDIAVVKVEDDFNFNRRIRGCDFVPQKVAYNNRSEDMEKAGSHASIAGWGSTEAFTDIIARQGVNSPELLETDVMIISKKNCKKRWSSRYHYIIDDSMICGKDDTDADAMSTICSEQEVNCKELIYSDEEDETEARRLIMDPDYMMVHNSLHYDTRRSKIVSGGFCENDHGGPLIMGHGKTSVVIGVMSACLTKDISHKCYGPFLYTSVWKHRHLISCAIDKEMGETCRRYLRASNTKIYETSFDWSHHPDGPAKSVHVPAPVVVTTTTAKTKPGLRNDMLSDIEDNGPGTNKTSV